jgi:nicotinamidase-related amidase
MRLLVVVDYQYDFVSGKLGFDGAEKLDVAIASKVREYRDAGDFIVETRDTHDINYLNTREGKHLPIEHCIYGTDGWEAYGDTGLILRELNDSEHVRYRRINKSTFGVHPFDMVDMLHWIVLNGVRFEDIDEIEFVGLVSNICVISNICVFQGAFPNAQIYVNPNLIASFDQQAHASVLEVMRSLQVNFIVEEN